MKKRFIWRTLLCAAMAALAFVLMPANTHSEEKARLSGSMKTGAEETGCMNEFTVIMDTLKKDRRQFIISVEKSETAEEFARAINRLAAVMENYTKSMNALGKKHPDFFKNPTPEAQKLFQDAFINIYIEQFTAKYEKFRNTEVVIAAEENMLKRDIGWKQENSGEK